MGGEVRESNYKGFMETFDPSAHHVAAAQVNQRLASATVRDEKGNFRVRPGTSMLRAKEEPEGPRGVSLARLQAEAEAEARAREEARRKKRRAKEGAPAATDGSGKRARAEEAAHTPVAPPESGAGWLAAGIVVKLLVRDPPELRKAKAVVRRVLQDGAAAAVELLDGGATHEVPAAELETVLPRPGGRVLVLAGRHRGARAVLDGVDEASFKADVTLLDAPNEGLQARRLRAALHPPGLLCADAAPRAAATRV
jgi:hypothetical protein